MVSYINLLLIIIYAYIFIHIYLYVTGNKNNKNNCSNSSVTAQFKMISFYSFQLFVIYSALIKKNVDKSDFSYFFFGPEFIKHVLDLQLPVLLQGVERVLRHLLLHLLLQCRQLGQDGAEVGSVVGILVPALCQEQYRLKDCQDCCAYKCIIQLKDMSVNLLLTKQSVVCNRIGYVLLLFLGQLTL